MAAAKILETLSIIESSFESLSSLLSKTPLSPQTSLPEKKKIAIQFKATYEAFLKTFELSKDKVLQTPQKISEEVKKPVKIEIPNFRPIRKIKSDADKLLVPCTLILREKNDKIVEVSPFDLQLLAKFFDSIESFKEKIPKSPPCAAFALSYFEVSLKLARKLTEDSSETFVFTPELQSFRKATKLNFPKKPVRFRFSTASVHQAVVKALKDLGIACHKFAAEKKSLAEVPKEVPDIIRSVWAREEAKLSAMKIAKMCELWCLFLSHFNVEKGVSFGEASQVREALTKSADSWMVLFQQSLGLRDI